MLTDVTSFFNALLGLGAHAQALTYGQVAARAMLIYLAGFAMLRFGEHRFLGKNTAFDVILGFVFGSLLSRAINGGDPFLPSLLAGAVLLTLHWLLATATLHSERLRKLIAGTPLPLIKNGEIRKDCLHRSRISESMLRENLRVNSHMTDPAQVREAYYEPSGNVSVIPKEKEGKPHVVEVDVEEGVETIRIALSD